MIRRMCDFAITGVIAGILYAGCLTPVAAQNVTCPTRPLGDNSNACASTAFVAQNALTGFTNHAVLIGRSPSSGFNALGPCNAYVPFVGGSGGTGSDPSCGTNVNIQGTEAISHLPVGNPATDTYASLLVEATTAKPADREFLVSIGLTANKGTGQSFGSGKPDKVPLYFAIDCQTGAIACWAANSVTNLTTTSPDFAAAVGYELDFGNLSGTDYGNYTGAWQAATPYVVGLMINGVGYNKTDAGITISGILLDFTTPMWNRGFVAGPTSINQYAFQDANSSAGTSFDIRGAHAYGFDAYGGTFTGAAVRIPNGQKIKARNNTDTGDVDLIYLASTSLAIGGTGVGDIFAYAPLEPSVNNTHTLGSVSFRWSTIYGYGLSVAGSGSGSASIVAQATAGTPTLTLPNASGTFAVSATSPLSLSGTTGALTCPTCATTAGANIPTIAQGDLLYGSAVNTLSALAKDTNATRYLSNTGTSNNPAWAQINLSNGVTNTLGVGNGGTGLTSGTSGGILGFTASGTIASSAALGANCIVYGGGAGATPATSSSTCPTVSSAGVVTVPNTTDASSFSTGAVQVTGGLSVAKRAFIQNGLFIGGTNGTSIFNIESVSGVGFQILTNDGGTPAKWLFQALSTNGTFRFYELQNYATSGGEMLTMYQSGGSAFGAGVPLDPGKGSLYVAGGYACAVPVTKTGTSGSQAVQDCSLIMNASGTYTLTLISPSTYVGRILYIKTIAAQAVNSASSNVVPIGGGAAGTGILAATAGKWAILQSDGTNWNIMASN